jgi:hypothetical protein
MHTIIIHGAQVTGDPRPPKYGRAAELWGCTRCNVRYWGGKLTDWDRWVDVHPLVKTKDFPGIPERRPEAWRWYCAQDGRRPIYLQAPEQHKSQQALALERFQMVPGATRFPIDAIRAAFPTRERWGEAPGPTKMFYSQVGMMLAFALVEGADTIVLNGIGQPRGVNHQHLHRDIGYWMGVARGLGVDVVVDGSSSFLQPTYLYAYDRHHFDELAAMRAQDGEEREDEMRARLQQEMRRGRQMRPPRPTL